MPETVKIVMNTTGDINSSISSPYSRISLVCSAIAAGLGILVMIGWITGMHSLSSLGSSSIPQAPVSSLAFILLGGTWFLYALRRSGRIYVLVSALFVLLVAILNLIRFFTGLDAGIEEFLLRRVLSLDPGIYGAGLMSPITAASFVLISTAMILLLTPLRRATGLSAGLASILASIAASVNLVVLLGYLYSMPVLYGGEIIPVSLPSGVALIFLGAGLIAASGPDHFPLRLLVGPSVSALLLRYFLLVISAFAFTDLILHHLFLRLNISTSLGIVLSVLISLMIISAVVLKLSRTIGGMMEREEAERKRAEKALRRAYDELEIRVRERTAELTKTNESLQADITERKHAEERLQHRTDMEKLIAGISTRFINLSPDEIDSGINHTLQTIGEFAGVDRSYMFLFYDSGMKMDNTHEWCAEGIEPQVQNLKGLPVDDFPWFAQRLRKFENIYIPSVADLPPEAHAETEHFQMQDIKSLIVVPMVSGTSLIGFLGFDSVRTKKTWLEEDVRLLKMVGEIFINALKRKQVEEELRRSNAELEQFAYVASHDLQEPLRMISGFTKLLARRYKGRLDKNADEYIAYVVDGATRMQQMIEDLLAYSRIGTRGKPFEPTDLEAVLNQAMINLKASIEQNDAVVTRDTLPAVMADPTQMIQLFQNLMGNAIKFRKKEEPPRIHVSAQRKGNEWLFSVRDNGIGIAHEFIEHLFQLFQREHAASEYPGTGIGLAICKKIVERHGGRIWAESEPGKGSIFYFTMPVRGGEIT